VGRFCAVNLNETDPHFNPEFHERTDQTDMALLLGFYNAREAYVLHQGQVYARNAQDLHLVTLTAYNSSQAEKKEAWRIVSTRPPRPVERYVADW